MNHPTIHTGRENSRMSYRRSDPLHVVLAAAIGVFALPVGGAAAACWHQLVVAAGLDGLDFWIMLGVSVVLTIAALVMMSVSVWAIVDVIRVRRM